MHIGAFMQSIWDCDHTCINTIPVFKVCYWVKKSAQGWQKILKDNSNTFSLVFVLSLLKHNSGVEVGFILPTQ